MSKKVYKPIKRLWIAAIVAVMLAAAVTVGGMRRGYTLLRASLDGRRERPQSITHLSEFALREQMHEMHAVSQLNGWLSFVNVQEVELKIGMQRRCAKVYEPVRSSEHVPWALVLHGGMGTDYTQVLDVACEFSLAGYRVLAPDLAAHGQSEGETTSLGLQEKEDVAAWIAWIKQRDPLAEIVIYGHDEGAVAVLLAAGEGMDESVRAIIADSPYLSADERCMQMLSEMTPEVTDLDRTLVRMAYRIVFGNPEQADVRNVIRQCKIPVLLIYGTSDEDTPAWYGEELLAAAKDNVRLLLIEGAVHGMARHGDPKTYYDEVLAYCSAALKTGN